jgi:hypothetical protein
MTLFFLLNPKYYSEPIPVGSGSGAASIGNRKRHKKLPRRLRKKLEQELLDIPVVTFEAPAESLKDKAAIKRFAKKARKKAQEEEIILMWLMNEDDDD